MMSISSTGRLWREGIRLRLIGPTLVAGSFLTVLLGLLALVLVMALQSENEQDRVRQTLRVRGLAETLLSAVRDAELQQMTFVLSGDQEYRMRFEDAVGRVSAHLSHLSAESRQPSQRDRLNELEDQIRVRIGEMANVINASQTGGPARALGLVIEDQKRGTMASISELLRDFDAEEDRIQGENQQVGTAIRFLVIPALLIAVFAALGLGLMWLRQEQALRVALSYANRKLEQEVKERTALLESERKRVETLLADMTHRIGNSLAMVGSFLSLEARHSDDAKVKSALEEANRRVGAIASAQRRLRIAADRDEVALADYLGDLVRDLQASLVGDRVSVRLKAEPVTVDSHDAVAVGIILNELVTNALKHAFAAGEGGRINVTLKRSGSQVCLEVADDGLGLQDTPVREAKSLGLIVIKNMVRSLHGDLSCEPQCPESHRPGTKWRLLF